MQRLRTLVVLRARHRGKTVRLQEGICASLGGVGRGEQQPSHRCADPISGFVHVSAASQIYPHRRATACRRFAMFCETLTDS
jgi:hypothetical protein